MGPAMLEQTISLWQRLAGWRLGFGKANEGHPEDSDFWVWVTSTSPSGSDALPETATKPPRWPALVQDISCCGMNLLVHHRVEAGTLLKVEAEEELSTNAPFLWVRVIHAVPADDAIVLGCVFPFELSEQELVCFGGQRLKPHLQDYRAWVRFPCDAKATYKPSAPSERGEWQAQIENVSPNGIGLIVSKKFEPGTMLNIALPTSSDQMFRMVLACVVRASPQEGDKWALGCSFATELKDEDLQSFGAGRVKSKENDCRTWVRNPCRMEMSYTSNGNREENYWSAKVLNISANGIGLRVTQPVEPGTLLNVDLHLANGIHVQRVLACVVYVKEMGIGEWMLGCTLASDLSLQE